MRSISIYLAAAIATSTPAPAATQAFLGDSSGATGESISVPLQFITDDEILGVQFDVSVETGSGAISAVSLGLDLRFTDHEIETESLGDGRLRVLLFSRNSEELYSGNLARIVVDLSADVPANARSIALSNLIFATWDGSKAALEIMPHLAVTSPARGARSAAGAEIQIEAESSDTLALGSVVHVEFYANNESVGSDDIAPYTAAWTPTIPGNYAITAVATSNEGGARTSPGVPVLVGVASGFEGWQLANFDAAELADFDTSSAGANPDLDRLSNAGEFGFGGLPLTFDAAVVSTEILTDASTGSSHLSFTYWRSIFATDVTFRIEESEALSNWRPAAASVVELLVVPDGDFERVTIFDTEPMGAAGARKMLRARIEFP